MAVIHAKVSAVSDGADTSLVQPSDWNAGHTINDIVPAADSTYKLGASGTAWTNVYTEVVSFPATQVPSSGANDLDDYEEGTWTPTLEFDSGSTGWTFSTQSGSYTKVGRLVVARFLIVVSAKGSTINSCVLAGLPFAGGGSNDAGVVSVSFAANFDGTVNHLHGAVTSGQARASLYVDYNSTLTHDFFSGNEYIGGSVTYHV